MMNVNDFLAMLRKAESVKTLYVMGGWGFPLTNSNKQRAYTNPYNIRPERKPLIEAASADTFAFDCCGLPRSVLWGWCADVNAKNGGAVYCANGVPEYDAKQFMFQGCTEQSDDFTRIEAGEFLWLDGHCGVYLGDGLAIESTPKWKDGVQITAVANIGKKEGYNSRTWTYHGHLKYVDYDVPSDYVIGETYNVICDELNIRSGPGTDYGIDGKLENGAKIACKALQKDSSGRLWMQGDKGWCCAIEAGKRYIWHVGWYEEDNKWYYYSSSGEMLKDSWVTWQGNLYHMGADGVMATGWQKIKDVSYYFYPDGFMARGEWIDNLYLGMDGAQTYPSKGKWRKDSKGWWYQDASGWYPRNRTVRINKVEYSFDAKGYLIGDVE